MTNFQPLMIVKLMPMIKVLELLVSVIHNVCVCFMFCSVFVSIFWIQNVWLGGNVRMKRILSSLSRYNHNFHFSHFPISVVASVCAKANNHFCSVGVAFNGIKVYYTQLAQFHLISSIFQQPHQLSSNLPILVISQKVSFS
jgi:hypothetical protein